jgi:DNA processing protein
VFAVPGNVDSLLSRGTNRLLRDGCAPWLETADVLTAIGLDGGARTHATGPAHGPCKTVQAPVLQDPEAARVMQALESEAAHLDTLVDSCGLDGARVLELLTALELAGLADRTAGGYSSRSRPAIGPSPGAPAGGRFARAVENRNRSESGQE